MKADRLIEIGIVLYPDVQFSTVLGLTDLFTIANRFVAPRDGKLSKSIRVSHWKRDDRTGQPVRVFDTHQGEKGNPAALVLPSNLGDPVNPDVVAPYVKWLREKHSEGAAICSVCVGTFFLAETGLLDGRSATTHWMFSEDFRSRFAHVSLDIDRLIVDDGDIITAGGAMAWIDLGLKLLDRFAGPNVMIETSRFLLIDPPGREQRYYSFFSPRMTHGDAAVLKVQHWLQATGAKDIALKSLVAVSGLEERTFLRRFRKATGMTSSEYCQRLRMGQAREMLQFSKLSVESVAWEVGYADAGAFNKVFSKIVGLTPGEYRQRFNAM